MNDNLEFHSVDITENVAGTNENNSNTVDFDALDNMVADILPLGFGGTQFLKDEGVLVVLTPGGRGQQGRERVGEAHRWVREGHCRRAGRAAAGRTTTSIIRPWKTHPRRGHSCAG